MDEDKTTVSQQSEDTRSDHDILLSIELLLIRMVELMGRYPVVMGPNDQIFTVDGQNLDKRLLEQIKQAQRILDNRYRK